MVDPREVATMAGVKMLAAGFHGVPCQGLGQQCFCLHWNVPGTIWNNQKAAPGNNWIHSTQVTVKKNMANYWDLRDSWLLWGREGRPKIPGFVGGAKFMPCWSLCEAMAQENLCWHFQQRGIRQQQGHRGRWALVRCFIGSLLLIYSCCLQYSFTIYAMWMHQLHLDVYLLTCSVCLYCIEIVDGFPDVSIWSAGEWRTFGGECTGMIHTTTFAMCSMITMHLGHENIWSIFA